jgi:menaquinone-dependent protoporphyrinogen oxidase
MSVLVAYASRYGSTAGIAEKIAEVLRDDGQSVVVQPVQDVREVAGYDAYVIGSSLYEFRWLKDATRFVRRHRMTLEQRPVWLFSSGPLGTAQTNDQGQDVREGAGPKELLELQLEVHPVEHHVFFGALDPETLNVGDKLIRRMMPRGRELMPKGDYRDWAEIEEWATSIGSELRKLETTATSGGKS